LNKYCILKPYDKPRVQIVLFKYIFISLRLVPKPKRVNLFAILSNYYEVTKLSQFPTQPPTLQGRKMSSSLRAHGLLWQWYIPMLHRWVQ